MMKIEKMPKEFEEARIILQQIENAGFEAFFVGGSVRDTLLEKKIHDVDIATSAYPAEIKKIFKKTVDTGIEHGTVMVLFEGKSYEITTFRTESGYQDYRRPDQVTFVRSLKEDLMRRDFTINAFALREDGTVIDIFNGLDDLKNKTIKAVGDPHERFHEDALRMMRAVRFASQLDFKIEEKTLQAIKENNRLLSKISVERILVEFQKMMLGQTPERGLEAMLLTHLNEYCPGFKDQSEKLQQLLKLSLNLLENDEQVWTTIVWILNLNSHDVMAFLRKWKTSNELIKNTVATLDVLLAKKNSKVDRLILFNAGEHNLDNAISVAKILGTDLSEHQKMYQALQIKHSKELAITGKSLIEEGIVNPGPQMGKILNQLKQMVIQNEVKNDHDELLKLANKLRKDEVQ